jgi:YHS domain-containing protein
MGKSFTGCGLIDLPQRRDDMGKDPVCGMDVDPKTAAHRSQYQGQTYYFCSSGCKKSFDQEPQKYVAKASTANLRD